MIVAIIQARMASSRLPGKVLAEVAGKPVLQRVLERVQQSQLIDRVVVATSSQPENAPLEELCHQLEVPCFRGSEDDVLDRFYCAAQQHGASSVVRITADCPLIDPRIIDIVIGAYTEGNQAYDYVCNIDPPTYPDGLDTEVFSFAALEQAWRDADLRSEREHVTLYIRRHPAQFSMLNIAHSHDLSSLRWVVDEPHDLKFVQAVYAHLDDASSGMADVLRVLSEHPELANVNAGILRNEGLLKSLKEDGYS
jgi:spore coat polysaccharide biosynthesis protein SpsF (cytidylyltransferase family)